MDPRKPRDPRDPRHNTNDSIYRPSGGQQQHNNRTPKRIGSGDPNEHQHQLLSSSSREGRGYAGHTPHNNTSHRGYSGTSSSSSYHRGSSFDDVSPTNNSRGVNNINSSASRWGNSSGGGRGRGIPGNNTPYRPSNNNNGPITSQSSLSKYTSGSSSSNTPYITKNDSFESQQIGGGGGRKLFANPCRIPGHTDHDWKDCPNNKFRRQGINSSYRDLGLNKQGSHSRDLGSRGFGRGNGLSSSYSSMDRDGSRVGGMSIDTDVSGHYGPASAVADNSTMPDSRGSHDSRGSFSERHMENNRRSSLDRGGSTGSGLGLSGESGRGYSDMALISSRSKSFNERDSSGSNERGGGRYQPSPKPGGTVGGGDRRSSWSGQRGGVDRGDTIPGREGHHYQRSPSKGSQQQGTYASMQQSSSQPRAAPHQRDPLPSPITSNSRGYSFTPQSQMKRSRSSGVDRSGGPHHQGSTPGSAESGQIRDDPIGRIPAPPFNNKNPSPGQVRSPLFHRANSSPGEIRTGEKKHPAQHRSSFDRHNRTTAEEGEEGEEEGGEIIESLFESPSPRKPGLSINTSTANDYAAAARSKEGPSPSPRGTPRGYTKQTSTASLTASPRGYATFTSPAESRRPSLTTDMSPAVTKTKLPSTPHHSLSAAAEAAAKKAAAEQATPKLPPLTCTSLGDADKISKAQDIVADMVELADFNSVTTDNGEMALPSKMQITQAMSIIENKIKLKGKEAMGCRKEVKALEVEEKLQAEKKVREQQERVLAVEHEFDMREKNRHEIVSNKKDQLTEARQKQKSSLVEKREAEVSRMNGVCQSEITSQNEPINAQVTLLYTQMQAAEQTIAEIDTAILQRELQESAAKYGTAIQPIIMAEDGSTDDGTGIPTMDMPGRMSALVGSILMQNQITAKKAHEEMLDCIPYFPDAEAITKEAVETVKSGGSEEDADYQQPPKELISNEEWCNRARKVTGQHDALYTEPSEVPFYHENNAHFVEIAPQIKDCIRRKNKKLKNRWKSLADQYVVRQMVYNETSGLQGDISERGGYHSVAGMIGRGGINNDGNSMDVSSGGTPSTPGGSELGVRGNNPYRRQRNRGINNGDVVRSDYELEQQIAEIAAKEAMEKRIKEGGCSLPRQRGWLENQLYATHSNGFFGREVDDELADDEERRHVNMWSDMEKCIFLDRFLHHPKDFRKIASFLKNKNTKDCIAFYYDSKKTVPYKHALKEFIQRKKRKGDVVSWDATIQSCLAMGAVIKAGTSPEQPLKFILPEHDFTYHTKNFHPMRLEVFENLEEVVSHAKQPDESKSAGGKKKRSNWFILDAHEKKYLKHDSSDDHHHRRKSSTEAMDTTSDDDAPMKVKRVKRSKEDDTEEEGGRKKQKTHKAQKWKAREKDMLYEALDNHGHDWAAISEIMGTRTPTQVKNYYYDNKKTITKTREKIAKIKAAADGRKKKKKRGLQGGIDTPKSLTPTTDGSVVDSRRTSLSSADAQQQQQAALQAHGRNDQDEQYRQQLQRMHQQDQLRQQILQQHLQQQQQQQRQEELYRHNQQMQQEEIYRQHLRQQEMLQMAQNAQHTFQQQQQNNAAQQQGNTVQQLQNLASLLQMRRSDTSPHPDNFQINQQLQQHLQDQQDQNADLQRMFQAAANSGIPPHALEAALAASRGNMQPQQLQQQQGSNSNPLELLRRLAAAQQQQQQQQQNQGGQGGYRNV